MAMRVEVMRAGYPYWDSGIKCKAKRGQEIVLHSHLAEVDHKAGLVHIVGRFIGPRLAAMQDEQPEPKRRGRPPGKKKGFFGGGE